MNIGTIDLLPNGVASSMVGRKGHVHILVFRDHKNNQFQNKLWVICRTEYINMGPNYHSGYVTVGISAVRTVLVCTAHCTY